MLLELSDYLLLITKQTKKTTKSISFYTVHILLISFQISQHVRIQKYLKHSVFKYLNCCQCDISAYAQRVHPPYIVHSDIDNCRSHPPRA